MGYNTKKLPISKVYYIIQNSLSMDLQCTSDTHKYAYNSSKKTYLSTRIHKNKLYLQNTQAPFWPDHVTDVFQINKRHTALRLEQNSAFDGQTFRSNAIVFLQYTITSKAEIICF